MGDPWGYYYSDVFPGCALGFAVEYLSGSCGFYSPEWHGYPSRMIDEAAYPAASWLISHGLPCDSDMEEDADGDGVDLLMAYALNLDPHEHLAGSLPAVQLGADEASIEFYASSPGVVYAAETSQDMRTWTREGVVLSDIDADGFRRASVARSSPQRFLRLVVDMDQ
jgi:hypothetical protein